MKTNKGFALGILIAIVAVLAVGGVVYYANIKTNTFTQNIQENNYQPPVDQSNDQNLQVEAKVKISSLSPISGTVGAKVKIYGSGFTSTGNKITFGNLGVQNSSAYNLNSSDGKTITFPVPTSNYFSCWDTNPSCGVPASLTQPGIYAVSVTNKNGTSNSVNFTVTAN